MVTAQFILVGSIYALEQCGILLRDAVVLYNNKAYSSAVVLAVFAREESGRYRILRELRKKVVNGEEVTIEDINRECKNHVRKQEWGQLSTVQRGSGEEVLASLHRAKLDHHPQSQEYKEAAKRLNDITRRQRKRTPQDRHKERLSALYVEPNETGNDWNRPLEKSQEEARTFIVDAVNDYSVQYDRLQRGTIQADDPELFQALQEWDERPDLPQPIWPRHTVGEKTGNPLWHYLEEACRRPWMGVYLRVLLVIFGWSALVHFANLLGFGERPWGEMPLAWKIGDVVYAIVDTTIVIGLWKRAAWGVLLFPFVIASQFVIFTVFVEYFAFTPEHRQTINGLLALEAIVLAVFVALLILRK